MTPWPSDPFGSEVPVYDLDGSGRHFHRGQWPGRSDPLPAATAGRPSPAQPGGPARDGLARASDDSITPQWSTQDSSIDTNQLWLTIEGVSNQLAYVELHATVQDQTYQLESTESLSNPITWSPEGAPFVDSGFRRCSRPGGIGPVVCSSAP